MKTLVDRVTGSGTANQQRGIREHCRSKSMVERVSAARAGGAQGDEKKVLAAAWRADGVSATDKRRGGHERDWPGDFCQSHTVTRLRAQILARVSIRWVG